MSKKVPKFVKLGNTALRLIGDEYYRDGGEWSIKWKIIDGKLLSWGWGLGAKWLHRKPLIEITEEEWRKDNGIYAPKLLDNENILEKCPECNNILLEKWSGVECKHCEYFDCL
jgi:hypothetical protein